jgi:hypothetical protein
MAFSGHRTLSEIQRYTDDVDAELLADQAMAKRRRGQTGNGDYTNKPAPLHKQTANSLKTKGVT